MKLTEIELELVGLCNAACGYCLWKEKPESAKTYMGVGLAQSILDQAGDLGVEMIRYHAIGESTLHPKLVDIMKYGLTVAPSAEHSLSTNCSMLTGELAYELAQLPIELILAVPWVDPKQDFVIRCMENAREYLKRASANKIIRLQMVCGEGAQKWYSVLPEFWPIIERSPNAMLQLKTPVTWPGDPTPQMGWRPVSFSNHSKFWIDPQVAPLSIGRGCQMPERVLMIRADGETAPCCVSVQNDWKMSSAKTTPIHDIWNSPRMEEIRTLWRKADDSIPCGHCQSRKDC